MYGEAAMFSRGLSEVYAPFSLHCHLFSVILNLVFAYLPGRERSVWPMTFHVGTQSNDNAAGEQPTPEANFQVFSLESLRDVNVCTRRNRIPFLPSIYRHNQCFLVLLPAGMAVDMSLPALLQNVGSNFAQARTKTRAVSYCPSGTDVDYLSRCSLVFSTPYSLRPVKDTEGDAMQGPCGIVATVYWPSGSRSGRENQGIPFFEQPFGTAQKTYTNQTESKTELGWGWCCDKTEIGDGADDIHL